MTKNQFANARYKYIHNGSEGHYNDIDEHHIVIRKGSGYVFFVCLLICMLLVHTIYLCLQRGMPGYYFGCGMLLSAILVRSSFQKLVVKESVVIFAAFGVQLETHYRSGRIDRLFIPIHKILKPILNEHVTPVTCYWSLALILHGEEEMMLAFKEKQLPLKMLIPIWKALCAATGNGEVTNAIAKMTTD
ncbi:GPI-GlcNAc transferase complex, PIG-H component, conserved domain [Dillenia turbinata]|uniref:GPI-GlcNAc transferase complex, PIG-H component, conserved domain n=1 Tax=Dillenia turbinata TaxID=194707 RepID=A0AAN8ZIL9_9MAGN